MNDAASILIHQALHGYADGHRQFALSTAIKQRDVKTLLTLSDSSGPGARFPDNGYLTGYPLSESSLYALARTWAAPEMPRPGCVWTHTLLIDFTDLASIEDTSELLPLFERPTSPSAGSYKTPLLLRPSVPLATRFSNEDARAILAALYGQPKKPIIAAVSESDPDTLALAVWSQQWPRLRRSFRFCTLAASDRSSDSAMFDLQLLPADDKTYRSRFPKAYEADRAVVPNAAWLADAINDLRLPDINGLRAFLRKVGGDVAHGREAFASLCHLQALLAGLQGGGEPLSDAVLLLDNKFEEGQARLARVAVTQTAASHAADLDGATFDFLIRNLDLLGSDVSVSNIGEVGKELWRRQPDRMVEMLKGGGVGQHVAEQALNVLSPRTLAEKLGNSLAITSALLERRPEIVGEPLFWSTENIDSSAALKVAADRGLAEVTAGALLTSGRHDLAIAAVGRLGAISVGRAIVLASGQEDIHLSWIKALAEQPHAIAELFVSGAVLSKQLLVRIARALSPDSVPNDVGNDPWLIAISNSQGSVTDHDAAYLDAFLMTRALGWRSRVPMILAIQSFESAHAALADRRMPEDGWLLLDKRLPWSWLEWDHCRRLRDGVVKLFIDGNLPPAEFNRLTSDDRLFSLLVSTAAINGRGRRYLKTLRGEMNQLDESNYRKRGEIIEKAI